MAETRVREKRPVLMVGLGGTGKQVLINFRRKSFEAYGRAVYPYIGHIMIDTDSRSLTLDGKEYDFLSRMVDFDASERLDVELRMSDLQNLKDRPNDFPHIHSWFDQRLFSHGEIRDGAAQIRSFGRLAFFQNYAEVDGKIRAKVDSIRNISRESSMLNELGIQIDANVLDVWIVFSIAGGTGSGMFLDVAFAIKHAYPNANIRGIVVLPSVFSQNYGERIFANAYSALMELEHYNYDRSGESRRQAAFDEEPWDEDGGLDTVNLHRFPVAWTKEQYETGQRLAGPVFQSALLVDNKPRGTGGIVQIDEKQALSDMMAEYLFVEYGLDAEPLADSWRSARSNFASALQARLEARYDEDPFPLAETFSCRYSSFGLSKLFVPTDRIASLVKHRLACDICRNWTKPNAVPSDLEERFDSDFAPRLLLTKGRQQSIHRELDGLGTGGEITQQVASLVREQRGAALKRAATQSIGSEVRQWVETDLMRRQLDCNSPTPADWGAKSRAILIQNPERLEERIKEELERILNQNLSEPTRRFTIARALLRRAGKVFEQRAGEYLKQMDRRRTLASRAAKDADLRLEWLDDCSDSFTRRKLLAVAFDFVEDRAVEETWAQIYQASSQVCSRIAEYIGSGKVQKDASGKETTVETGLVRQLGNLEALLQEEVVGSLESRLQALERESPNPINVNLFESEDASTFYKLNDGRGIDQATVTELDRRFFEQAPADRYPSLWGMRGPLERLGPERLMNDLVAFAGQAAGRHLDGQAIHAIDRLGKRHKPSSPQFEAQVMKLVQNGNPWLEKPSHYWLQDQAAPTVSSARWIAIRSDESSDANQTFRDLLDKNKDRNSQLVDSTPDRVYVACEMAGQPLMAIPGLLDYRNTAYRPLVRKSPVHSDMNIDKFGDLLPMDPPEASRYKKVLEVVAYGLILGILKIRTTKGMAGGGRQFTVSLVDTDSFAGREEELGPISVAIWQLMRDGDGRLIRLINKNVRDRRNEHGDSDDARLVALLHFDGRSGALPHNDLAQAMTALAAREVRNKPEIKDMARKALDTVDRWANERPARSGFWTMPWSEG